MIVPGRGRTGQTVHRFENGFGASVISDGYGAEAGLYELGVIVWSGENWSLTYTTPITSDVLGFLSREEVDTTLAQIAALTSADIVAERVRRLREEAEGFRARAAEIEAQIAELEVQS